MSEYRVRATGEVKSQGQIRLDNKNMSLPRVWTANVCDALGVDPVLESPKPAPSGDYKSVVRNGVVQDSNGNWVQAWVEREMFTEYTDEDGKVQTVAAQKTVYDTLINNNLANSARVERDALLKETDHYGLSDVTMSDAMKTYRQALRDVPQQTDFPSTISWPTKP
jgi:hypothetical protein|tara:strand:+ start:5615 stop:6112 length:498 start_codon:yes stop_codon:yes gene_type:complete